MQVYNVTDFYGSICADAEALLQPTLNNIGTDEIIYVEADGSMIFTCDEDWKEVKVGRIFKSSDCSKAKAECSYIKHSQYLSHLGDSKSFTDKMDTLIDNYNINPRQIIFISDGATWIKNWIEDAYPKATSVLDYYHAAQHLYEFANTVFSDEQTLKLWANEQCDLLKESQTETVIDNIEKLRTTSNKKEIGKLINYYQTNKNRMDYKKYSTIGAGIIGSGAIESAHRTLVQNRCKQAGQRWSKKGAQNMLNLKTVYLNEKWNNITTLCKTSYPKAA